MSLWDLALDLTFTPKGAKPIEPVDPERFAGMTAEEIYQELLNDLP
jgi:hypothetical protein